MVVVVVVVGGRVERETGSGALVWVVVVNWGRRVGLGVMGPGWGYVVVAEGWCIAVRRCGFTPAPVIDGSVNFNQNAACSGLQRGKQFNQS